jgi:hypothetical protein
VIVVVAALGIATGAAASTSSQAAELGHAGMQTSTDPAFFPSTASQVAFHDQMRKLWEDHVTWTRLTIVSAVGQKNGKALPDLDATLQRLHANQDDIGAAIVPFFGQAAGDQLAALLHEHISGAVELVLAAKAGDDARVDAAARRWYDNAQEIADFLAGANPEFWPQEAMREAMHMHLDQTLREAVDRLNGNYEAEVQDYDQAHLHILMMADILSSGIIQAFPDQFA